MGPHPKRTTDMKPHIRIHLVFSLIMGALMISVMTLVITAVNLGLGSGFPINWAKAFVVAYVVGTPMIFLMAPAARKITGGLPGGAALKPGGSTETFESLSGREGTRASHSNVLIS